MAASRQATSLEASGRVNQKHRTRTAIVAAAQEITARGELPTVAQAAEAALVSRTTAYRYFPTQESLLLALAVDIDVRELDELANRPLADSTPGQRVLELIDTFNRHALANERLYRTGTRHYMDAWLAADSLGERDAYTREGRRARWIAQLLEPLRSVVPHHDLDRLEAALCLLAGGETIAVLRDICRLDPDQAVEVAHWAATLLLQATVPSMATGSTATHEQAH
jgi:AcrR family transcriptional regulator